MMSRKKKRQPTDGGEGLTQNPFGALPEQLGNRPAGSASPPPEPTSRRDRKNTKRGRVDIVRETAHRGGKIVTVVTNFKGIGLPEKQELAKKIQKTCGVGGTVKDGRIEIRGDLRDQVKEILEGAGFQPVFAGG
jgi:translation initiation factor 1